MLLIRADAASALGTGHVMRCLALAQAWQDHGGQATFAVATKAQALKARLRAEGFGVVPLPVEPGSTDDASQTVDMGRHLGVSWVIVDGYQFDGSYRKAIKDGGMRLLAIDDIGFADHCHADLVLNQNLHAHEGLYPNRDPQTQLLLGTRYALLRREFSKWNQWRRGVPDVGHNVLVTLGGSDPNNVTRKVVQALQQIEMADTHCKVVVGPTNPHLETLQQEVARSGRDCQLLTDVADMAELMAWADLAISAGGSTCWELAFMGVPVVVTTLAENQRDIVERLGKMGVAVDLGWYEDIQAEEIASKVLQLLSTPDARAEMARRGQEMVDGKGAERVLTHGMHQVIQIRQACEWDCRLLWTWANDPDVRAASFSSQFIPWEEHVHWFESKLQDSKCIFLIGIGSQEVPIGQVRIDVDGNEAEISVSTDRKLRGQGYGRTLICEGSLEVFASSNVETINAYIKPDNVPSVRAFLQAGFKDAGRAMIRGHQAIHLVLRRDGARP